MYFALYSMKSQLVHCARNMIQTKLRTEVYFTLLLVAVAMCSEAVHSSESDVNVRNEDGATLLIVAAYYQ